MQSREKRPDSLMKACKPVVGVENAPKELAEERAERYLNF